MIIPRKYAQPWHNTWHVPATTFDRWVAQGRVVDLGDGQVDIAPGSPAGPNVHTAERITQHGGRRVVVLRRK